MYDFMRWATQHKVSGLYISDTLVLNLRPDPDLVSDFKIQIETYHRKRVVTSFYLPHRPCRCGYWFSSYRLGAFIAPPQKVAGGEIPQQLQG